MFDSRDAAIFEEVIKDSEFEELVRTLEKVCEEACRDKQLKKEFRLVISDIKESRGAKTVEDLFLDQRFEQAVMALEKIYIAIYGRTGEYDSEYQHFLKEIKRISDSQPKERKSSSVRMWIKIVFGAATAAAVATYVKKRNKEKKKGEEKSPSPG
ncbi:MAG TPA: hypothetical protein VF390_02150 [Patescibacteria group bacterium]